MLLIHRLRHYYWRQNWIVCVHTQTSWHTNNQMSSLFIGQAKAKFDNLCTECPVIRAKSTFYLHIWEFTVCTLISKYVNLKIFSLKFLAFQPMRVMIGDQARILKKYFWRMSDGVLLRPRLPEERLEEPQGRCDGGANWFILFVCINSSIVINLANVALYVPSCPHVDGSSVWWSVCHNFLRGGKVTLPYTCLI